MASGAWWTFVPCRFAAPLSIRPAPFLRQQPLDRFELGGLGEVLRAARGALSRLHRDLRHRDHVLDARHVNRPPGLPPSSPPSISAKAKDKGGGCPRGLSAAHRAARPPARRGSPRGPGPWSASGRPCSSPSPRPKRTARPPASPRASGDRVRVRSRWRGRSPGVVRRRNRRRT